MVSPPAERPVRVFFCTGSAMAALSLILAACATLPEKPPAVVSVEQAVAQADEAGKLGQLDKAYAALSESAKANPTRKEPWLKTAQLNFDAGNYGQAIVAAQEALQRDGTDRAAQSIVAVSALRLATRTLSDMVRQDSLNGSVRSEAETLAKSLRDSLGETILVPRPAPPSQVRPTAPASRKSGAEKSKDKEEKNPFGNVR